MTGLGAWYTGLLMSRAQKEAALTGFFADAGDYMRLAGIWQRGGLELGYDHPDVSALNALLGEIAALSNKPIAEIDAAIDRAARAGQWPYEPLTFDEWYRDTGLRDDGLGVWIIAVVVVVIVTFAAASLFDPLGIIREKTILAKARAVAIQREAEARGKAIEDGREPGGTSPFEQPSEKPAPLFGFNFDWKVAVVAGAVAWLFLGRARP